MNTTELYPHLPAKWREQVSLGLRSRGASGATIGSVLAEAEAHCGDSGESAVDAFGQPLAYAAHYPLSAAETANSTADTLASSWPTLLGLAGMLLALATTSHWSSQTGTPISAGLFLGGCGIVALTAILVWKPAVILTRMWLASLVVGLGWGAIVALQLAFDSPLFHINRWLAVAISVALEAACVVATRGQADPDVVTDPLHGDPNARQTALLMRVTPRLLPALTVLGVGLIALINATG